MDTPRTYDVSPCHQKPFAQSAVSHDVSWEGCVPYERLMRNGHDMSREEVTAPFMGISCPSSVSHSCEPFATYAMRIPRRPRKLMSFPSPQVSLVSHEFLMSTHHVCIMSVSRVRLMPFRKYVTFPSRASHAHPCPSHGTTATPTPPDLTTRAWS